MTISNIASEKGAVHISVDQVPSICAYCHRYISPNPRQGWCNGEYTWVGFTCPTCNRYFIASYNINNGHGISAQWNMMAKPFLGILRIANIQNKATEISTNFVEAYSQSIQAEELGLDLICGVGLRKALEFLMKDYASSKTPNEVKTIQEMPLSQVIDKYVTNDNIKNMAKRAVWLGNDETHYVKRWEAHDLQSLKVLIDLTLHWIESEILTEQYNQLMPGPKK